MALKIYTKDMRKKLMGGIIPALLMGLLALYMAVIWPEMAEAMAGFEELMQSPIYQAMIGSGILDLELTTFKGVFAAMIGFYLLIFVIIMGMFKGTKLVSQEIEKETMDIILSYPIPRWRLLLEKFAVINTYSILFVLFTGLATAGGVAMVGIKVDMVSIWITLGAAWFLFYTAYAISLLCGVIFLKSAKSLMAAGGILIFFLVIDRLGGAVESTEWMTNLSIFSLLDFTSIMSAETLPVVEVIIVFSIGTTCLIAALVIFERREITY